MCSYLNKSSASSSATNSLDHERPGYSLTSYPQQQQQQPLARNTTKSFNIEGLTVYFDEFIVRDDYDLQENNPTNFTASSSNIQASNASLNKSETSLNSTIELSEDNDTRPASSTSSPTGAKVSAASTAAVPTDEAAPFNFELNSDYYLYTNPIIMITFGGIQSIKLTVNNFKPTELIMDVASGGNSSLSADQQRPLLELSAQFGSIKCLLCPKQIHLLGEMLTKVSDYVESVNQYKHAVKSIQMRQHGSARKRGNVKGNYGGNTTRSARKGGSSSSKPIRGFVDSRSMDDQGSEFISENAESEYFDYSGNLLIMFFNAIKFKKML